MSTQVERFAGTLKWYNQKKGFGFLTPANGGEDVFIHHSALKRADQEHIQAGDRVTFGVEQRQKGPSAIDVRRFGDDADVMRAAKSRASHNGKASNGHNGTNGHRPADVTAAVSGDGFAPLGLSEQLLDNVRTVGYVEPTPIQTQAIPPVLAGRDVLGSAQTGTGKTAAFALPIIQRLMASTNGSRGKRPIRAMVLSPTRELALQIDESFRTYGRHTGLMTTVVYGGVSQKPQVSDLRSGVDVLIATPGRLLDLMGQGHIKLGQVEVLVLDEADRMLDMGFIHDVQRVIKAIPNNRQTLLFSATMPREIVQFAYSIQHDAVQVEVSPEQPTVDAIEQAVFFVPKQQKQALLEHVLDDPEITRALVFTRTKHGANRVVKNLSKRGISAEPMHGNKSQAARQRALKNFRNGRTRVLVATDVASRGIDVDDISHVIQFDLSNEPETYVHRIGRTGRAGSEGVALAFCADAERSYLKDIESLIKMHVPVVQNHPHRA